MRFVQEDNVGLLEMLSSPLRAELKTAIFEPRMAQHPLFVLIHKLAPLTMQLLCTNAVSRVTLAHGDILFQSGQLASQMYFLTMGKLSYEPKIEEAPAPTVGGQPGTDGGTNLEVLMSSETASVMSRQSTCSSMLSCPSDILLSVGQWVSEVALWVEWTHGGSLSALTDCDLVALDAEKFQKAIHTNVNTRTEATLYAKGFVLGLNRMDKSKVNDLFQSGLLEGLWFRLLNEYNVKRGKRRGAGLISNSLLFNAKIATSISAMFSGTPDE
jgi:hypothetical protein